MRGEIITPEDRAYDDARKVWNGDVDRRPAVIARCVTVDDVKAALAFGRSSGLQIAVRAGGHSFPGHSIADDALGLEGAGAGQELGVFLRVDVVRDRRDRSAGRDRSARDRRRLRRWSR
jgi:FAD/FMN-containing dehydrogenase